MQDSLKIEYTQTHHRREHNFLETTQTSFLANFKATRIKVDTATVFQRHYVLYDIL